ncbi:MAG: hypothetical protein JSS02_25895 [Planctomycetes bacterium]|nr:hypothetical protein [Planctomycetota bacterium]
MSTSAQVKSIDAVVAFRGSLRMFQDQAARALLSLDEQAQGALQWLEHDAPAYWRNQIRVCYDEVGRARAALETCKMKKVGDYRPACIEEQEALRQAQRRLREAEEKLEVVRRWRQRVVDELDEYRGRVSRFRETVEAGLPRSLALLDRTINALDAYLDRPEPVENSGTAPASPPNLDATAGGKPA